MREVALMALSVVAVLLGTSLVLYFLVWYALGVAAVFRGLFGIGKYVSSSWFGVWLAGDWWTGERTSMQPRLLLMGLLWSFLILAASSLIALFIVGGVIYWLEAEVSSLSWWRQNWPRWGWD